MYPADALADALYSENDLPDAVTVDGVSFNRSGTDYGNTSNGVILEGNVWAKYASGSRSSRPCLIQGGVVDQFADTYTVAWNISNQPGSSTATRQSLCIWTFTAPLGEYLIQYESVDFFRWRIVTPETEIFKAEPSFENTPTGYYETGGEDFTVS
jgi:hypothetical protein